MRSKKRTVVILIVVIVMLLGFAGSLLVYRNKLSSENAITDSDVYTAVDKELYEKIVNDEFENASLEERKEIASNVLNKLENENKILKGSIKFNEEYNCYFFLYSNGAEGSIMLDDFSTFETNNASNKNNEGGNKNDSIFDIEKGNFEKGVSSNYVNETYIESSNNNANGYIKENLSTCNLTYYPKSALIVDCIDDNYERYVNNTLSQTWTTNDLKTDVKSNVTVEQFKTILNGSNGHSGYDFINIDAHGNIDYNGNPVIILKENQGYINGFFDGVKYSEDRKEKRVGVICSNSGLEFYLTSNFFTYYYSDKLIDTIIWLSCCKGYINDTLVSTFANECNAKAVIGLTDTVIAVYDNRMRDFFIHKLLFGHTVDESLKEAKSVYGKDDAEWYLRNYNKKDNTPAECKNYNGGNETLVELVSINTNGMLSGTVTDENGNPIKGAEIVINNVRGMTYGITATTNENGEYTLECPKDSYKISVKADGYKTFETEDFVSVNYNEETIFDIILESIEIETTEATTTITTTSTTESTPTIPEEASTYNGHFYMVYPESMTWQDAKVYCENLGGHLVTISDADEQKFIEDLAEKYTDKVSYWLGGYYSDAEWKWVDDTEFSYTNWDSWTDGEKEYRQPDNFTGDEFYLRFANQKMQYENWYSNKGKWNDIANEADGTSGDVPLDSFGLICEWDNVSQDNTTETEATANIVDSGTCGDNLAWTLDTNGQLTIEGKGEMYNYYTPYNKSADNPPWRYQKIRSVVIKSGVTSIGNGAFGWQDDLGNVSIADTVTSIGVYSFFSCDSLVYLDSVYQIPEKITSIGKGAFDLCCNMRCVYVGKNVTKLDDYSLDSTYIGTIYGYEGSEAQAYAGRNGISFVCVDDDYGYQGTISNQNGASFRSGSSEKSKEISVIPYGTEVSEYDSTGDWALIKYKGTLGYVYKDDLLFEGGFAKPVIYLYPEKKQDVSVKVNFKNGDFTCTYPEYNNGWNVTAYPNGRIINKSDNDEYSYLYWEGEGAIQYDFSSGFVVKREDTAEFLKEKLSYMGLSPKEYNEFIVYWLPIMQKNKYNLISFQMENYEESAQLEVSPKPDSMLRVFMAFQEADADTKVPEQQLKPFQREGFTVIEWGGTEVQ